MKRCIQLAQNGLGTTYPNPLVGSVIVHKNNIIGEGWHFKAGLPHAEVNAINSVQDKTLLKDATIYVSLEPCSHFGRTPPCANLIVESGIKKVVIGSTDPNPKVAGKGIKILEEAGCEITLGILEKDCKHLNKRFFTFQNKKRPYIILKWAQTQNSYLAPLTKEEQTPVWITNSYSRQRSHKLRVQEQGILIGTNTAIDDNPSLNARDWNGKSPTKILIDRDLKVSPESNIFNSHSPLIIFTEKESKNTNHIIYETVPFSKNLAVEICSRLHKHELQSIIVEGGAKTLQAFIDNSLWDEAQVFIGKNKFTNGIEAPKFKGVKISEENLKSDTLHIFEPTSL